MNITNFLMPLIIGILLVAGVVINKIKDKNTLWITSVTVTVFAFIVNLILLINYKSVVDSAFTLNLFVNFGISFKLNGMGILFGAISSGLWVIGVVHCKEYFASSKKSLNAFYSSLLITLAGVLGVFFANDLFTVFVFFEAMSFASYLWVAHNKDQQASIASKSYLAFTVIGGIILLMGIFILYYLNNDISLENLNTAFASHKNNPLLIASAVLMFIGFGIKAGLFMLNDWLPLAYAASPAPASGLLSGVLSKTGIYAIILITVKLLPFSQKFAMFVLIVSILSMLSGGFMAFVSNDIKRILAFSSISQIGFILWGVALASLLGSHNTLSAFGSVFHMINHSLVKVLLFTCAGIMYQNKSTHDLNKLKGYGKNKPWLKAIFGIGAISLAGVPIFSGYISKTLLHEAIVEYIELSNGGNMVLFRMFEGLFLIAGGFTVAYMIKLFVCIFMQKPKESDNNKNYASTTTKVLLSIVSGLLVVLGLTANTIFAAIGNFTAEFFGAHALQENVQYFSLTNLKGSLISITIGLVLYFVVARRSKIARNGYKELFNRDYTFENLVYRPVINACCFIVSFFVRILDVFVDVFIIIINKIFYKSVKIPQSFFDGKKPDNLKKKETMHLSYSLAYSFLLFGIGLILTLVYLIVG